MNFKKRIREINQVLGHTLWVLLWTYTVCLTVASIYSQHFWEHDISTDYGDGYGYSSVGTSEFYPLTNDDFFRSWSIEEYLFYILLPWIVTYQLKKGQRSDA